MVMRRSLGEVADQCQLLFYIFSLAETSTEGITGVWHKLFHIPPRGKTPTTMPLDRSHVMVLRSADTIGV